MKRILLFLLCAVFTTVTIAQPANNECLTADPIAANDLDNGSGSCGNSVAGTTVGATTWDISGLNFTGNCWNGIDTLNVVFYTFDAQGVSGSVEVLNGPDDYFISVIQFTAGACDGGNISELGCGANVPIVFDNDLTVTTTYYVIVAFANNTEGAFDLCVFNPVPADNDECDHMISLTRGITFDKICVGSEEPLVSPGGECKGANTQVDKLHVTFERPNPNAVISGDGTPYNNAAIVLTSKAGSKRAVVIRKSGQISVETINEVE